MLLVSLNQIISSYDLSFVRMPVTQVDGKTDVSIMIVLVAVTYVVKYSMSNTVASRRIAFSISIFIKIR